MSATDPTISAAASPEMAAPSQLFEWAAIAPQLWEKQQALLAQFQAQLAQWAAQGAPRVDLDPLQLNESWQRMGALLWAQPDKFFAAQIDFWQRYYNLSQTPAAQPASSAGADRRFRDPRWQTHPYFSHVRQSYELLGQWWQERIDALDTIDARTRLKLNFALRQMLDAISPSNQWWSNPEVLDATLQQRGQNLLKGMDKLLADFGGAGKPRITMAPQQAFAPGDNLAVTSGSVVFENELVQIIQYVPQTKTVHQIPLVIIAPWINKYYVLDLQTENSFINWAVQQGYTVFVTSWASANAANRHADFSTYLEQGFWTAVDVACRATGEAEVNVIGYCIGGTLATLGLAEKAAKRADSRVRSITFFTTLIDFAESGELTLFTDEASIARIEGLMAQTGYLDAWHMHTTFNLLRANDLIWSFVVNNYLLGKEPFPFDLLHWNADSTHIPAPVHTQYLREMYLHNKLATPNAMVINGTALDVGKITVPACFISAREDHIAPWEATYRGARLWGGAVEFILAGSGHIAGIVNPPAKNRYGYRISDTVSGTALPEQAVEWLAGTTEQAGSWWPHWEKWLRGFSGKTIPASRRTPGGAAFKPIEPAPGRYVQVKSLGRES